MIDFGLILIFFLALSVTVVLEAKLIPRLKRSAAQPIYEEGPRWHLRKSGTPTMGGIGFAAPILLIGGISSAILFVLGEGYFAISLILTLGYAAINALIGVIDDTAKIRKQENAGLSPLQKLILQGGAAALFMMLRSSLLGEGTTVNFSFGSFDLGILYYPVVFIMLLGTVNCANLTDGIDGLASGVALAIFVTLATLSVGSNTEVFILAALVCGAMIGFLTFNLNPARIFMGDTGSLFLGALAASGCIALGNPFIILSAGCVYLLEGLSVIIQVSVFKLTGKRAFKMAPLHHHLEKCGWTENTIVIGAIILTLTVSLLTNRFFV